MALNDHLMTFSHVNLVKTGYLNQVTKQNDYGPHQGSKYEVQICKSIKFCQQNYFSVFSIGLKICNKNALQKHEFIAILFCAECITCIALNNNYHSLVRSGTA